jgi:hypothetical protein
VIDGRREVMDSKGRGRSRGDTGGRMIEGREREGEGSNQHPTSYHVKMY